MTKSKVYGALFLPFLTLLISFSALASKLDSEESRSKIIFLNIDGMSAFADYLEDFMASHAGRYLLISDVDGVQTNLSVPDARFPTQPRGDIGHYTNLLIERGVDVLYSSAWPYPTQTVRRLQDIGIPCEGEEIKDSFDYKGCSYDYVRQGNCISIKRTAMQDPLLKHWLELKFYRQKAFAPLVKFGEEATWDYIIFIDDSEINRDYFEFDIKMSPFYDTVKTILLVTVDGIHGTETRNNAKDKIKEEYLAKN